jgi:DNA-binding Lrp family transcriptional regulator
LGFDFTDEKGRFAWFTSYYADAHVNMTKAAAIPMDDLDRNIIAQLSTDARMSVAVLARRLRVARSTVQARLERLESTGAIAGYTLRLGEGARSNRIRATVLLGIEPRSLPGILSRLKVLPQVERIHTTSGRVDLLLQLATGSTAELDDTLDRIGVIDGVRSSESLIHLSARLDRAL